MSELSRRVTPGADSGHSGQCGGLGGNSFQLRIPEIAHLFSVKWGPRDAGLIEQL